MEVGADCALAHTHVSAPARAHAHAIADTSTHAHVHEHACTRISAFGWLRGKRHERPYVREPKWERGFVCAGRHADAADDRGPNQAPRCLDRKYIYHIRIETCIHSCIGAAVLRSRVCLDNTYRYAYMYRYGLCVGVLVCLFVCLLVGAVV